MTHVKEAILREYRKLPGTLVSDNGNRIDLPLPSDHDDKCGKITMIFPGGSIIFNMIDIKSMEIPAKVANPIGAEKELLINYCLSGRCEIKTMTGECTYLTAGEIAVYAGHTTGSFYYPTGEYKGFEVVVCFPEKSSYEYSILGEKIVSPEVICDICDGLRYPWIQNADNHIKSFYDSFKHYTEHYIGSGLILLKCIELLTVLSEVDYSSKSVNRTYYTASQTEIAKRVRETIMSDLSVRFTARALADEYGISETSLKNYFRSVYGCGYAEYQQKARMKRSCELLAKTDLKVAEIGQTVGYATQAKFGSAFKDCHGVTPLEYRRQKRLKEMKGAE